MASRSWPTWGLVVRAADHVAPADVDLVGEADRDRHRRERLVDGPSKVSMEAIRR
jgi:hypothetical protein